MEGVSFKNNFSSILFSTNQFIYIKWFEAPLTFYKISSKQTEVSEKVFKSSVSLVRQFTVVRYILLAKASFITCLIDSRWINSNQSLFSTWSDRSVLIVFKKNYEMINGNVSFFLIYLKSSLKSNDNINFLKEIKTFKLIYLRLDLK